MDSLRVSDEEAAFVQRTPNRVSLVSMLDKIQHEYTFTVDEVLKGTGYEPFSGSEAMTIHIIVMQNGFVVIGTSAPADPENFDVDTGERFAREDAIRKLWPLEGYALKERMNE